MARRLCSFSVLSNSFISICLTFLFPGFYFPCCFSYLVCLLSLALCVETSGYEMAGWVSETSLSVWRSLWYISRPLPCIIDSLSLITVSTITDEPLLPAAPALRRVSSSLSLDWGTALKRFCYLQAAAATTTKTSTTGEMFLILYT